MRVPFNNIKKNYDIIIIGAGICGLTLIDRFLENKFPGKILVIESGSMLSSDPYPNQFEVTSTNLKIKKTSRYFGVGGGSNVWGPLHGLIDKDKINYHFSNSQFPISYDDYIKYINISSEKFLTPNSSMFETQNTIYNNLKSRIIVRNNNKLNFFSFSSVLESDTIDFVENVNLERITFNKNEDVAIIKCKKTKDLFEISGKYLILSSGTLENIKTLYKSIHSVNTDIGKGFMNHPKGMIGFFKSEDQVFKKYIPKKMNDDFSAYTGFQLKSDKYLNSYLRILEGLHPSFLYQWNYVFSDIVLTNKNLLIKFLAKCCLKIVSIITKIIHKLTIKNYYSVEVFCELEKNYYNSVKFSKNKLIVNYKISDREITEVLSLLKEFEKVMNVKIKPYQNERTLYKRIKRDSSHHMGGLAIGNDEKYLINNKLKVKLSNNTYITGGSAFNFSDSVNPTLSYIALSLYLSDYLSKKFYEN